MDGTLGSSAQSAKDLSLNLSKNISIPITMWDERLSSQGSFNIMRNMSQNISGKRKLLDQNACCFHSSRFFRFSQ